MVAVEVLRTTDSWIEKTPGKCGGRACIRDTRIPVWSVVVAQLSGVSDQQLLTHFVTPPTYADVQTARAYRSQHGEEIDADIRDNENA